VFDCLANEIYTVLKRSISPPHPPVELPYAFRLDLSIPQSCTHARNFDFRFSFLVARVCLLDLPMLLLLVWDAVSFVASSSAASLFKTGADTSVVRDLVLIPLLRFALVDASRMACETASIAACALSSTTREPRVESCDDERDLEMDVPGEVCVFVFVRVSKGLEAEAVAARVPMVRRRAVNFMLASVVCWSESVTSKDCE
jgi:hypothetical protein